MNPFILFLAGGYGFFAGLALFALALYLGRSSRRLCRIGATLAALFGVILIVVSTTPIFWLWYVVLPISVVLWIVSIRSDRLPDRWRSIALRLMLFTIAAGLILEVPYFVPPRIPIPAHRRLVILADSITAGVRDGEQTWPMRLGQNVDYEVVDLSHVGAVVADGADMIDSQSLNGDLVLIELGGNDLLGGTSPEDFRRELDTLLKELSAADCTIVMFELPLPPFYYQYGYAQRSLASRYKVTLIPKRYLLHVLVGEQKTLDSIHLTDAGHRQLAELMQRLLATAMKRETSN